MQTESTVKDILNLIEHFRILCVGRSGVGKSSIINRVFGLHEASVEHWNVGEADIERELTSVENPFFVLHDSKGFEPGNTKTFDMVREFIVKRRKKDLPPKDRLHAVWLCTETPVAGGRVFETGDERLLQLAQQTETPVVVVFTKYDKLFRTKKAELQEDKADLNSQDLQNRSKEEARKALDICVQSLHSAIRNMDSTMEMPPWEKVSIYGGYDAVISSLVEVTSNVVQEKLKGDTWVMWAIAQRVNLPLKIEACTDTSTAYYRRSRGGDTRGGTVLLRDCLKEVHTDIITCWNFGDEDKILSSDGFGNLMLYLVQDVRESLKHDGSRYTRSRAIDDIFQFLSKTTPKSSTESSRDMIVLPDWLKHTVLQSTLQIQLLLMAYTVDLTTVLKSLFDISLGRMPQSSGSSGRITWSELKVAFEAYESSHSRQRIHHRLCDIFHDEQIFGSEDNFRRMFDELLKDERQGTGVPISVPVSRFSPVFTPASPAPPKFAPKPAPGPASKPAPVPETNRTPTPPRAQPDNAPRPSSRGCMRLRCFSP